MAWRSSSPVAVRARAYDAGRRGDGLTRPMAVTAAVRTAFSVTDQPESAGHGRGGEEYDEKGRTEEKSDDGRGHSGEAGHVQLQRPAVRQGLHRDQRGEQRDRDQFAEPPHPGVLQHALGHDQPGHLEPVTAQPGRRDRAPHGHRVSSSGSCAVRGAVRAGSGTGSPGSWAGRARRRTTPARAARAALITGTPGGSRGVAPSATSAASTATRRSAAPAASRGHSRARNAAGPTSSSPYVRGSPSHDAPSAPPIVDRFQTAKMLIAVAQNPARAERGSGCAVATAVVSSMTTCAVSSRRQPRTWSVSASRSPYRVFRPPSSTAPAAPAIRFPPPATTPISANSEAPVNASRLSAHACAGPSPAATAAAPNATPDSPTANPTPSPSRTAERLSVESMPRP